MKIPYGKEDLLNILSYTIEMVQSNPEMGNEELLDVIAALAADLQELKENLV